MVFRGAGTGDTRTGTGDWCGVMQGTRPTTTASLQATRAVTRGRLALPLPGQTQGFSLRLAELAKLGATQ